MILVSGGSVFDGDAISLGCNRSRVMRSSVDRYGVMRSSGGSVFGGDAILVVVRDIWRRQCWVLAALVLGCDRFWVDR